MFTIFAAVGGPEKVARFFTTRETPKTVTHAWRSHQEFEKSVKKSYYTVEDGSKIRVSEVVVAPIGEKPSPGSLWSDLEYIGIVKNYAGSVPNHRIIDGHMIFPNGRMMRIRDAEEYVRRL